MRGRHAQPSAGAHRDADPRASAHGTPRHPATRAPAQSPTSGSDEDRSSSRRPGAPPHRTPGPTDPALRANPYPEVTDLICRLPLSTLFQHARGCKPWRPAADMGTAWREIYTFSPGFSRASESSPDAAGTATLSRARAPLSGRTHSRAPCPSQRKENSSRGCRRLLRGRLRHRTGRLAAPVSAFQVRGSEPDSLSIGRGRRRPSPQPFRTAFAYPLGPTDPCSTAVHMEPFSTSAFKVLV